MDVFVTGGSGFVGQHLIRALVTAGHGVQALARSDDAAETVSDCGATAARGDVGNAVVHAAALTSQWDKPERFEDVNVRGTAAVLNAARQTGVRRLVLVSTEAVLADGSPLVNVDEQQPRPPRPMGDYARTKGLAEDMVLAAPTEDFVTVAVRPRLVWGPGDTSILPELAKAVAAGQYAWIDGGRYLTSTCHVANVCEGIRLALEHGRSGQAYFLSDGEPVELREFLTALAATAGTELPARSMPRPLVSTAARVAEGVWRTFRLRGTPPVTRTFVALSAQEMTVDDGRARRELGYRPVLTRDEGLANLRS